MASTSTRTLRLLSLLLVGDEEAVALVIGLQAAAQSAVEGIAESLVRALAKGLA